MKFTDMKATVGAALVLLSLPATFASRHHEGVSPLDVMHRRHSHKRLHASPLAEVNGNILEGVSSVEKRGGQCQFPSDAGLVAVTPGSSNAGWALSPDQACEPGNFCPYACPPGQVSMQWNPLATAYTYPMSMVSSRNFRLARTVG